MTEPSGTCCESCMALCCPCYNKTEKFSKVKYSSPSGVLTESSDPVKKLTFEFRQPPSEFTMHPQIKPTSRVPEVTGVVANQPRLFIPKGDASRSSRESSPVGASVMPTYPTIQYCLYYDIQRNVLAVHLQQIYNLPAQRKTKNLDTVVTLYLTPQKEEVFESKVVQRSLNPFFGQHFEFSGQPGLELTKKKVLIFKIFEHGKSGRGMLLGVAPIKLEEADLFGETTREKIQDNYSDLSKRECVGDILISLMYLPHTDTLKGLLLKLTNLKQQDITGTADPYVKVCLYHKGKSAYKWKSSIKKNTLCPVFNEAFQFSIFNMDTSEMHLDIVVMDYDRFSRDDTVGMVQIGADIPEGSGRTHWEEVISGCNESISRWHQILPH